MLILLRNEDLFYATIVSSGSYPRFVSVVLIQVDFELLVYFFQVFGHLGPNPLTLAGNNAVVAARLVVRHSVNLMNDENWPHPERWLNLLPEDIEDTDAVLHLLKAWINSIYSRYAAMGSCLEKAEALCAVRTTAEHLPGHLDALRGFNQDLAVNGEGALACSRQALEKIPRNHRWARVFAFINQAGAHQMLGNREKAFGKLSSTARPLPWVSTRTIRSFAAGCYKS
jgi:hypothetical protein